jgi:hypothetical protein
MMLFVIPTSKAQTNAAKAAPVTAQQVRVIEALPDGDFILSIDGTEYRAISADHARDLLATKAEAKALADTNQVLALKISHLENALTLAHKDASLADLQRSLERERADKFQAMYQGESDLRKQSESLRGGTIRSLFDNPWMQVGVKLGLPILGMVINGRR